MLMLEMTGALAGAVQRYGQQAIQADLKVKRVTALNAAAILLGYQDHRQARSEILRGDEPCLPLRLYGRTYMERAQHALDELLDKHDLPAAASDDVGRFAKQMLIEHDYALWELLGGEPVLTQVLDAGMNTVVADPRMWVSTALQRALTCELSNRYGGRFGMIDHAGLYQAGLPNEHRLHDGGLRFSLRPLRPNIFYRARVDFTCERIALPIITEAVLAEYDSYMLSLCASVHAVFPTAPEQAVEQWASLPGHRGWSKSRHKPYALIVVRSGRVAVDMLNLG